MLTAHSFVARVDQMLLLLHVPVKIGVSAAIATDETTHVTVHIASC